MARLDEASLRQKSNVRWLELGDHNSAFFRHGVHSWQCRNELHYVVDSIRVRHSFHESMVATTVEFF